MKREHPRVVRPSRPKTGRPCTLATIGGETRTYARGDTYYVPASIAHSAVIHPGFVGIDVFADADRYSAREGA